MTFAHFAPRSLNQLVFLAFILVITPIGFMFYHTSMVLEELLQDSHTQTKTALELSQRNHRIGQKAEDIVRTANQFRITSSPDLQERLHTQLVDFTKLTHQHPLLLSQASLNKQLTGLISELEQQANSDRLPELLSLSKAISSLSLQRMSNELANLEEQAKEARNKLWLQAILLILATLILVLFFAAAITRPIALLIKKIKAVGQRSELPATPLKGPGEIKQLNDQINWLDKHLTELEQTKGLFIRHISHELKTPLTTMREGVDLLAEEIPGPLNDKQHHVVELMQKSSLNLQHLIEQLLDYNRLQMPQALSNEPVDLDQMIAKAISSLQLSISEKSLDIILPRETPAFSADSAMLSKVLNNLISNAIHYTGEQGRVLIGTNLQENRLTLDVENSGHAIPEADVTRIFEPFFQSQQRTGPLKGSGIGLSIAQEASKVMKGDLILAENTEGKVVFRLTIPVQTP